MLLSGNRSVITALSCMAMTFVAGIAAGFALPTAAAEMWAWIGCAAAWGTLALYGWGIPCPKSALVFMAGCALAMRTECSLAEVKSHARMRSAGGGAPTWRLEVESGVSLRRTRGGELAWAQFMSHLGPQPVRVTLPVMRGCAAPRLGEVWECEGWLNVSNKEARRYRTTGLWVAERNAARRIAPAEGWRAWRRIVRDVSGDLSRRIGIGLSCCPEVAALNRAMLLGRRADVSVERRDSFVVSGTIHVFAISGLHVMLIARLLERLLTAVGVPMRTRAALVIALVSAYATMTGARASAVRAALMAGLYYSAAIFGRRPDSLAAWSLAVFVVYGLAPERLFDMGCALSFIVMLGVVVWLKWAQGVSLPAAMRRFLELPAPVLLRKRLGWLFDGYSVSSAAWVAGVPVAARLFGRFTWGGLVANIVAAKLAACTVAVGFLGVAASYANDTLAALFNLLSASFTLCLLAVASLVARLPDIAFPVARWSILECAAWYGAFLLALIALERILPKRNDFSGKWWT